MIWFFGTSHTAGTCHGKWHQIYPEHYVGKEDFLKDQFYLKIDLMNYHHRKLPLFYYNFDKIPT